ncbi:MAG: CDP-glycerol glycerophosphotransferase family protein, partial [Candidatus Cloacimonetes bacterium]|nr:CDP-glycerol glycerophosphotransferase family protein [Candidatus Cloacimonadota bacterium]
MNLGGIVLYLPYRFGWWISRLWHRRYQVDFFCGDYVDYICFREVHKLLPDVRIVTRSRKTWQELAKHGIAAVMYPTCPDMVIMAKHATYMFPVSRIVKIGMRHGAYHFKDFIAAPKYNAFTAYMMTSSREVELAEQKGIRSGHAIGYPKLDPLFNGTLPNADTDRLGQHIQLDPGKKTVLFTATWDKMGYSAVDKWLDRISELTADFNILVTVHQWLSQHKKDILRSTPGITFINDNDILPYLAIVNIMVGDISSIIAEGCALDKPIITFDVPETRRFTSEIRSMLEEISFRVDSFDELVIALHKAAEQPEYHSDKRSFYNRIMFDDLDGKA